jgi:hypothetical protein
MAEPTYDARRVTGSGPAPRLSSAPPGRTEPTKTPKKHGHKGKGHQ